MTRFSYNNKDYLIDGYTIDGDQVLIVFGNQQEYIPLADFQQLVLIEVK